MRFLNFWSNKKYQEDSPEELEICNKKWSYDQFFYIKNHPFSYARKRMVEFSYQNFGTSTGFPSETNPSGFEKYSLLGKVN